MKKFVLFYVLIIALFGWFFYHNSVPEERVIRVLNYKTGQVEEMAENAYLTGVVAGEMPESFHFEALKSQAVAARTYLYEKLKNPTHQEADICNNPACCCALQISTNSDKIKRAVYDTNGEYITYENQPISAVFHSAAGGGRTENSEDVWQNPLPYLKSVETKGEDEKREYETKVSYSLQEFKDILKNSYPEADFNKPVFENISYTKGNSVDKITLYGVTLRGVNVRSLYNLRSACFDISLNDGVTFTTCGYGHGVGMSQYGANYMASQGKNYREILTHYYTGVEITKK
ncbi:MAG: stage II sporulation protein D [Clostridia bacterium]|nr:stage II sporulation protein D [Clostridia bacterium]